MPWAVLGGKNSKENDVFPEDSASRRRWEICMAVAARVTAPRFDVIQVLSSLLQRHHQQAIKGICGCCLVAHSKLQHGTPLLDVFFVSYYPT